MAFVPRSRVAETTTTTGTGDITLGGVIDSSYLGVAAGIGANNTFFYGIETASGAPSPAAEWGLGTVAANGLSFQRTTVLRNHLNTTQTIDLPAGTKNVFAAPCAEVIAFLSQINIWTAEQRFRSQRLSLDNDDDTWIQADPNVIKVFALGGELMRMDGTNKRVEVHWDDSTSTEGPELKLRRIGTSPAANDPIGLIRWSGPDSAAGNNETTYAKLRAVIDDATDGSEDGSLEFSVVANGVLIDAMRIEGIFNAIILAAMNLYTANKTASAVNTLGAEIRADGAGWFVTDGGTCLELNRKTSDGRLVGFRRDGTIVADIAVASSVVSYNTFFGAHHSWWADGARPSNVADGTLLETADGFFDANERLPLVRVAQPGSKRVYGVYHADGVGDGGRKHILVGGLGAYWCRVKGPIEAGDLLAISDVPGVAMRQDDDIIRSATVGKATQTDAGEGERLISCVLYCG